MRYITIAMALLTGNLIYQFAFEEIPNIGIACERSFFQAVALFVVWVADV